MCIHVLSQAKQLFPTPNKLFFYVKSMVCPFKKRAVSSDDDVSLFLVSEALTCFSVQVVQV